MKSVFWHYFERACLPYNDRDRMIALCVFMGARSTRIAQAFAILPVRVMHIAVTIRAAMDRLHEDARKASRA